MTLSRLYFAVCPTLNTTELYQVWWHDKNPFPFRALPVNRDLEKMGDYIETNFTEKLSPFIMLERVLGPAYQVLELSSVLETVTAQHLTKEQTKPAIPVTDDEAAYIRENILLAYSLGYTSSECITQDVVNAYPANGWDTCLKNGLTFGQLIDSEMWEVEIFLMKKNLETAASYLAIDRW